MNTNPEPIDFLSISSLVPRAKAGSDDAREEICRQLQDYLRLMADKHLDAGLRRKLNPSDVVQQTMIRMIDGFANFRGETTPEFYGWLNKILRNEINAARRNNHRAKRNVDREEDWLNRTGAADNPVMTDPNLTPSSEAINREKMKQFESAIEQMSADYATVIRLRSLDELSFDEVAKKMNRSYDSVTKLWYRAVVKLQEILDQEDSSSDGGWQ